MEGDTTRKALRVLRELRLGFPVPSKPKRCLRCRAIETPQLKMKRCAKCHVHYCSREHQVADWKAGHKLECALVCGASSSMTEILESKMIEIRLYVVPFAICKRDCMGTRGFVFLRSPTATATELALRNERGDDRDLIVEYLLVDEFDALALENQFELVGLRTPLRDAVDAEEKKKKKHLVCLMLLRDGYACLFTYPVVPDEGIARSLGLQYAFDDEEKRDLVLKLDTSDDDE